MDIADLPKMADSVKVKWLHDPNYNFYKSSAQKFGFMLDFNAPWSLTADFKHPVMQAMMEKYGVTSSSLFRDYYYETGGVNDFSNLKEFLMSSYNVFVESYPTYQEVELCVKGDATKKTKITNRYRERVDLYRPDLRYDEKYWLELYYYVRLLELGSKKTNLRFNQDVRKIMLMLDKKGLDIALDYANMLLTYTKTNML